MGWVHNQQRSWLVLAQWQAQKNSGQGQQDTLVLETLLQVNPQLGHEEVQNSSERDSSSE
jgi:hypothetical protein